MGLQRKLSEQRTADLRRAEAVWSLGATETTEARRRIVDADVRPAPPVECDPPPAIAVFPG